jgi:hypothetical protein|tara:strand:+ start:799 stop:1215 length:417 start_codon:yes stop_codon:yes gene_type:complete
MRIENWDTKLSDYIQKQQSIKFKRGKSDCVNFVIGAIKTITEKLVFDMEYKSLKDAKKILEELNKKDLLDIAMDIARDNNFKEIDCVYAQRGDVVFLKTDEELGGTLGVCIGQKSIFRAKNGVETRDTNSCNVAWRIE